MSNITMLTPGTPQHALFGSLLGQWRYSEFGQYVADVTEENEDQIDGMLEGDPVDYGYQFAAIDAFRTGQPIEVHQEIVEAICEALWVVDEYITTDDIKKRGLENAVEPYGVLGIFLVEMAHLLLNNPSIGLDEIYKHGLQHEERAVRELTIRLLGQATSNTGA